MSKSEKTNEERKRKYEQLRRVGFSVEEANRYKDHSAEFVEVLCNNKASELADFLELFKKFTGKGVDKEK